MPRARLLLCTVAAGLLVGTLLWWLDTAEVAPPARLEPGRIARREPTLGESRAELRAPWSVSARPAPTPPRALSPDPQPAPATEIAAATDSDAPAEEPSAGPTPPAPADLVAETASDAPAEEPSAGPTPPAPADLVAETASDAPAEEPRTEPKPEAPADLGAETASDAPTAPRAVAAATPETGGESPSPAPGRPLRDRSARGASTRARPLSILGRVTAAGLRPVAEARVDLVVTAPDGRTHAFASAPCKPDGTYALEVLKFAPSDTIQLCALAPGFEPTLRDGPPPGAGERWKLDLPLCPGEPLTGRLVDATGAPVAGGTVSLLIADRLSTGRGSWALHSTPTFADGSFSLPRAASGELRLHAAKEGLGTAWSETGGRSELGDLRLSGGPPLAGVVRRPDGSPVRHLVLEVTPRKGREADRARTVEEWLAERFDHERGDGLLAATTLTDRHGRFRVGGLRPGPYLLRARRGGPSLTGGAVACSTGDEDLELSCNARSLRLSVVDETGAPLEDVRVLATVWGGEPAQTIEAAGDAEGIALDLPEACERLGLFVTGPGRRPWAAEVPIAPGARLVEREAVLPPAEPPGRLALAVHVPEGLPSSVYRVAVRPATISRPTVRFVLDTAATGEPEELEPGSYRVDLLPRGGPGAVEYHRPLNDLGPVVVSAGETARLDVQALCGGRIDLSLPTATRPDARALGLGPERTRAEREATLASLAVDRGARVWWASAGSEQWRPLELSVTGARWRARRSWLLPGLERGTSALLDAGTVRLRVEAEGCETFETELVVEAGRNVSLAPTLSAE
ncbi:MAG: hypothetical protein QF860_12725 [Planctomycetota bacterium]|nr:hypothetical protein [Planctomycetota bacterium]